TLMRFLGMCGYYRKFVQGFAQLAEPLHKLLVKNTQWLWSPSCQQAFENLRDKLCSAPILAHPDYSKPFILSTDASTVGLGAILSQRDDKHHEHPIVYLSRSLQGAEKRYTATELECLAIVWALSKLRGYVEGATLEIITDHSALQWILSFKGTNSRLLRWSFELQQWRPNITITHKPGKNHTNVDTLSRIPPETTPVQILSISINPTNDDEETNSPYSTPEVAQKFFRQIKAGYQDDRFKKVIDQLQSDDNHPEYKYYHLLDGILYFTAPNSDVARTCVPKSKTLRKDIMHDYHASATAAHLGIHKTQERISALYYWPGMFKDIANYVRTCPSCQANKPSNQGPKGLLQPLPIPAERWHTVSLDFLGPLSPSGPTKFNMILVVVDKLTKCSHFIPCHQTDTAPIIAGLFFDNIIRHHGLPKVLLSDRDAKFTSLFWSSLFRRFGTKLAMSSSYHPQTDGQSESMVKTVKTMLRQMCAKQSEWSTHLPAVEFAYNSAKHPSTGLTPFELDLGYSPRAPHDFAALATADVPSAESFAERLHLLLRQAQDALARAQEAQAEQYNKGRSPSTYEAGQLVLLSTKYTYPPFFRAEASKALLPPFIGPYQIARVINPTVMKLDLPPHITAHSSVNIQYLKPYHNDPYEREPPPPPPVNIDENRYEIDFIRGHRQRARHTEFLIHWLGYPDHEDSWVPESQMTAPEAIADYWSRTEQQEPHISTQKTPRRARQRGAARAYKH
ncbi:hypothetical protein B9479_008259, partial [Cryptococcus floricola]